MGRSVGGGEGGQEGRGGEGNMATEGGQQEVGDGGGGKGEVKKNGKIRGDFTDGYDGMPGWT